VSTFLTIFLPAYLFAYLGTAFFWRSFIVWRKTGINPYRLGTSDTAHDFIGSMFRLMVGGTIFVVWIYAGFRGVYPYLTPITWLEIPTLQIIGLALLVVSLIWIVIAQIQMGNSWRVGIDTSHPTELVQIGLYKFSRNPIFLGMRANLLGFFLLLPNALSLAIWVLGDAVIQIQVRLEEEHLSKTHGERYADYCRRTRRWI
jgi:protein-S-isoprenylcysteine O-methyltransferase Ste14